MILDSGLLFWATLYILKPEFHLALHVSSRHDSTRSIRCRVSRDERVEPRAVPTWRTIDKQARLYKFCRFYALTYTNLICSVK